MFFLLIFLILAAATSYIFPEWSWASVLLLSLAGVATLRILLALTSRSASAARKTE